jgi:hypothetical protein
MIELKKQTYPGTYGQALLTSTEKIFLDDR